MLGLTTVAVLGTGPVATVLASAAEESGLDVVVCGELSLAGLSLELDGRVRKLTSRVSTDPADAKPVDWVLLAQRQRADQVRWLAQLCRPRSVVLGIGTWVDPARSTLLSNGMSQIPALAPVAAEQIAPGYVLHHRGRRLGLPAGPDARAFAELLAPSWLTVDQEADFRTACWRALLRTIATDPITAIACRRIGILKDPQVRTLAVSLLTEAIAVGSAEGALLSESDVSATLDSVDQFADYDGTAMLSDRLAGRALDYEDITGAVIRLGRKHGVPTPVNQGIYALLRALSPPRSRPSPSAPAASTS